ncbi:hypothetical protein IC614_05840 [Allosphingosinicella flava]|uniref:Uncharacterized protein n=1 Tax=Allosphingosinicella flava TaxID=2771430 RepID=A0A7T2GLJ5_9SPHN|nr:hypothetical protein [Sphingosinicella flava]QPQ56090.1 hypothetical protein IC614_05840 [Sphingosinicella flava]
MHFQTDAAYHRARALRELDLGLKATSLTACEAHLKLSSLHMERARISETRTLAQGHRSLAQCA